MPILLFSLNSICYAGQSSAAKVCARKGGNAEIFNLNKALSAAVLFLLWVLLAGNGIHLQTAPPGILYGLCLMVSMHTGLMALSCGPMALTSILASMSLIIPLLWGIILGRETLFPIQSLGILLLLLCIFCICYQKQDGTSKKWLINCILTMLSNGICSVIQKYHQTIFPGKYQADFMFFAMGTVLIVLTLKALIGHQFRLSLLGSCSGVLNGIANFIVLLLAANQAAATLFPLVSAGNVLAAWICGILFFRENIHRQQLFGLLAGISGIVLLNI